MADTDLELKISSSVDLSGLHEMDSAVQDSWQKLSQVTGKSVDELKALAAARKAAADAAQAEQLSGAAGLGYSGITTATKESAQNALLMGANLARARNEAVTLVRELAAGAPVTRTLGALLGALGIPIAATSIALFGVLEAFAKIADNQRALNEAFDKNVDKASELANKLREGARGALSPEDVGKVADEGVSAVETIKTHLKDLQSQTLGFWKSAIDNITSFLSHGVPGVKGWTPFQNAIQKAIDQAQDLYNKMDKVAGVAIEAGIKSEEAFKAEKLKPMSQAVADVTNKIKELQAEQAKVNLNLEGGPETWKAINDQIEEQRKRLVELTRLDRERQSIAATDLPARLSKLDEERDKLEQIKKQLEDLGVAANTPQEAFNLAVTDTTKWGESVRALSVKWGEVQHTINQIGSVDIPRVLEKQAEQVLKSEAQLTMTKEEQKVLDEEIKRRQTIAELEKQGLSHEQAEKVAGATSEAASQAEAFRNFQAHGASISQTIAANDAESNKLTQERNTFLAEQKDLQERIARGARPDPRELKAAGLDEQGKPAGASDVGADKIVAAIHQLIDIWR